MTRAVPPIIYSMWLQGVDQAPPIVRLNFERWERLNPGYRLKVLEGADVGLRRAFLPRYSKELGPQALSDVVRAYFLMATGGIWVDASVYPAVPLDEWLPSRMTSSGFFAPGMRAMTVSLKKMSSSRNIAGPQHQGCA